MAITQNEYEKRVFQKQGNKYKLIGKYNVIIVAIPFLKDPILFFIQTYYVLNVIKVQVDALKMLTIYGLHDQTLLDY